MTKLIKHAGIVLSALFSLTVTPTAVVADGLNPTLNKDFTIRLGTARIDGEAKVRSELDDGHAADTIDFGSLGIDGNDTSTYLGARWRFSDKWRLVFESFGGTQEGTGIAQAELDFGDLTIPVGVAAYAKIDVNVYAISLGRSFIKDETKEFGVGIGLHIADMSVELAGAGFIDDVAVPFASESADATAPLPSLRFFGGYAFSPEWALEAGLGLFSLTYDKYEGNMTAASVQLEWRPHDNLGVGFGYTFFDIDVKVDHDDREDSFEYKLDGPLLYLAIGF